MKLPFHPSTLLYMVPALIWLVTSFWVRSQELPPFVEPDEVTYEPMPVGGRESAIPIDYRPGGINVVAGGKLLLAVTPEGAIECYDSTEEPEPCDCMKTLLAYMVAKEMER